MNTDGKINALSEHHRLYLEDCRDWVRANFAEDIRSGYETLETKLALVKTIIESNSVQPEESEKLQALGVTFGDALAQANGLIWVSVEYGEASVPELWLPDTTLKVAALVLIQKRVQAGEDFEVVSLFDAFCHSIGEIKRKLTGSFFARFSQRLAGAARASSIIPRA